MDVSCGNVKHGNGKTEGSKEGKSVHTISPLLLAPLTFSNDFYEESTILGTENSKVNHTGNALESAELTSNQERRGSTQKELNK